MAAAIRSGPVVPRTARIGVKCWINKGEVMPEGYQTRESLDGGGREQERPGRPQDRPPGRRDRGGDRPQQGRGGREQTQEGR